MITTIFLLLDQVLYLSLFLTQGEDLVLQIGEQDRLVGLEVLQVVHLVGPGVLYLFDLGHLPFYWLQDYGLLLHIEIVYIRIQ